MWPRLQVIWELSLVLASAGGTACRRVGRGGVPRSCVLGDVDAVQAPGSAPLRALTACAVQHPMPYAASWWMHTILRHGRARGSNGFLVSGCQLRALPALLLCCERQPAFGRKDGPVYRTCLCGTPGLRPLGVCRPGLWVLPDLWHGA